MSHPPASRAYPHPCSLCALSRAFCPAGEARAAIDRLKTSAAYDPGSAAFHEMQACHSVFLVCSGRVKLMTASRGGRTLLLRLAGPGELLAAADALTGLHYSYSAIAVEPAVLSAIPRETFLRLVAAYAPLAEGLTVALSEEYEFDRHETRFLGFGESSSVRLARVLLDWASAEGKEGDSHVPAYITHSDLAQAIGATRETVTRILGDFRHRGIIVRDREEIVIRNAGALAQVAGG